MTRFRIVLASAALTFAASAVHAQAQAPYPSKVIRIITSAPGSNNDWASRLVGEAIGPALGQRFIVENRGGLAVDVVAKAPPDGYTLLFYGPAAWTQHLFRETSVDPLRDLAPITMAMSSPIVLVVHPSLPVKNVRELIALAKARPGELNYASGTVGATPFLAGELFKYMAGVNIVRVAYKGTGPSMIGVMSGEAQVMFPGAGSAWNLIEQGKLRALGVASAKPSPLTPGLQPIGLTVKGYESTSQMAFLAPAGTPAAIIERLHQEIVKAINRPDVKKMLFKGGVETEGTTPKELRDYIEMDIARIQKMLKATGFNSKAP
ncbi:MAG TPA: tripartite tricarboxylate transporter substrate-binding protein [Burkholderiales bacterium]|nr:tripartite tricarboxylate transporter substrate-binding protein [Burkholderiales bacterium]